MNRKRKNAKLYVVVMAFLMLALFNSKVCFAKTTDERPTTYLVKGDSITLKVSGATDKKWSSSNENIVTVSQKGVIKAKKVGEATVKAATKNKCYVFKVIVVDISKIKFSPASKTIICDTSMKLNVTSSKYSSKELEEMKLTYGLGECYNKWYDYVEITKKGNVTPSKIGSFTVYAFLNGHKVCSVKLNSVEFQGVKEKDIWVLQNSDVYITLKNIVKASDFRCYQSDGEDYDYKSTPITKMINGTKYVYKIKIHSYEYPGEYPLYIDAKYYTKKVKIKIGIPPVEAVKTNNYDGYSGEAKKTLIKTREIIDSLNLFSTSLSDREKITILQSYFSNNMEKGNEKNHSPASSIALILLDGTGYCGNYSTTMCFICDIIGIPCYYVRGGVYGEDDWWGHAWNRVKLDGEWYYTDVTYTTCLHSLDKYFLTKTLWNDHRMTEEIYYKDYIPGEEQYLYYSDLY